jgi:hypothetical protein
VYVIGHDTPGNQAIPLALPETQCVAHELANARIVQRTRARAAIEILFDFCRAEFGDQHLLGRQKMSAHTLCRIQNAMTFRHLLQYRPRQGVRKVEGDEIQACVLLPMGKAASLPNAHFTEPGLHCTLNDGGGRKVGTGVWFGHNCEFYAERVGADGTSARQPVWRPALLGEMDLVPHDLIDEVATRLWVFHEDSTEDFQGPYEEWKGKHN